MRYVLTLVIAVAAAGCNSGITCKDDGNARCPGQPKPDGTETVVPVCVLDECRGGSGLDRVMCTESGPSCDGRMECVKKADLERMWEEQVERCD